MSLRHMRRRPPQMFVENIKVKNFKSFKDVDVSLNNFNVLIGANASGKSNFTEIFNFLKHLATSGLDDAISLQGGLEYLQNFNMDSDQNLVFKITLRGTAKYPIELFEDVSPQHKFNVAKAIYHFEIKFTKQMEFKIIKDNLVLDLVYAPDTPKRSKKQSTSRVSITNENNMLKLDADLPKDVKISDDFTRYVLTKKLRPNSLLIENTILTRIVLDGITDIFFNTEVYDFDPKLAKRAIPIKETVKLKNDGSNIFSTLKKVLENDEYQRRFTNLITNLLPYVDSVSTKKIIGRTVSFTIKERYFEEQSLPSTLVSDGTVNIVGLILASYFQFSQLTIIEGLERNIHPSLISQVVENMNESSRQRQVIVTTHSPEIIRYTDINNILTVRRDDDGNSEIVRPGDQKDVKDFLKNDMDIEELYVQNLLGD